MLQAWGKPQNYDSCRKDCKDGHWLIAIGYDTENFYFEDPSLNNERGFINIKSLDSRWHDIELYNSKNKEIHNTDHYGIAIWGNNVERKEIRAREIM